jgi:hypothetical protein
MENSKWNNLESPSDKIKSRWKKSGLLDNLSANEDDMIMSLEVITGLMLQEMALVQGPNKYLSMIMPIMTRILKARPEFMNYDQVRNLYVLVLMEVKNSYHLVEDLSAPPGIDPESELCGLIAEKFINQ